MTITDLKNVKAIETSYKGYRFRSRLEARWAVFFDNVGDEGIPYRYEIQSFVDKVHGLCYLPDFYLPLNDVFLEIKPNYPSREEQEKAYVALKGSNKPVWFLIDEPGSERCYILATNEVPDRLRDVVLSVIDDPLFHIYFKGSVEPGTKKIFHDLNGVPTDEFILSQLISGSSYLDWSSILVGSRRRQHWKSYWKKCRERRGEPGNCYAPFRLYENPDAFFDLPNRDKAIEAARAARFEFGEEPSQISLQIIRQKWPQIHQLCREQPHTKTLGAILDHVTVMGLDNNTLILAVTEDRVAIKDKLDTDDKRQKLMHVLKQVLGVPLQLKITVRNYAVWE